jgi:hypothetical protein
MSRCTLGALRYSPALRTERVAAEASLATVEPRWASNRRWRARKPLMVILDEQVIEDTKVAAVLDKRKISGTVQELLQGWLAGRKSRK